MSADPHFAIGEEFIRRQIQILRRGAAANPPGRVVLRAVARTEPSIIVPLMRERNAPQVGANADDDQPLVVPWLGPCIIRLGIRQTMPIDTARLVDLLLIAMRYEDR